MKRTKIRSKRQLGQGMTEYIIIVALIAIGAVAVFTAFGKEVQHEVAGIAQGLAGQASTADVTAGVTAATHATTAATAAQGMENFNQNAGNATMQQ
jgi:hypothetical protein